MSALQDKLVELMQQALVSPAGVLLQCENPEAARNRFLGARTANGDPELLRLQFRGCSLPDGNLAITKAPKTSSPSALDKL